MSEYLCLLPREKYWIVENSDMRKEEGDLSAAPRNDTCSRLSGADCAVVLQLASAAMAERSTARIQVGSPQMLQASLKSKWREGDSSSSGDTYRRPSAQQTPRCPSNGRRRYPALSRTPRTCRRLHASLSGGVYDWLCASVAGSVNSQSQTRRFESHQLIFCLWWFTRWLCEFGCCNCAQWSLLLLEVFGAITLLGP